jgi:hypothetical protein
MNLLRPPETTDSAAPPALFRRPWRSTSSTGLPHSAFRNGPFSLYVRGVPEDHTSWFKVPARSQNRCFVRRFCLAPFLLTAVCQ